MIGRSLAGLLIAMSASCASIQDQFNPPGAQHQASEAALHEKLLTLDAHLDTPALFHLPRYDFSVRGSFDEDRTSVDLPRLLEGRLDGGFWVIYTGPGPL
ncbi:MAG: membrane dipeptidase, partial [Pseudomonadota bacterium]